MDIQVNGDNQPVAQTKPSPEFLKMCSMAVHLSFLIGYVIPLANIIIPLLVYNMWGKEDATVKENARIALNMAITVLIAFVVLVPLTGMIAYLSLMAIRSDMGSPLLSYASTVPAGILGLFGIYSAIMGIVNGVRVSKGERTNYPLSLDFIRKQVE